MKTPISIKMTYSNLHFQKIKRFPSNVTPLLSLKKSDTQMLAFLQILLGLFFLFCFYLKSIGYFYLPLILTIFFAAIMVMAFAVALRNIYRLTNNKILCLARDTKWLYLDELDPRRIKLSEIQEAVIIENSVKLQRSYSLRFKMKNGKTLGRFSVTWWPVKEIKPVLTKQHIKVIEKK